MTTPSQNCNTGCKESLNSQISTSLLNELPDAVFLIDPVSSKILYANKVAYESVGLKKDEVLNTSVMSLQEAVVNQPQWSEIVAVIKQATEPYIFLGRHQRKDGSSFPVEVRTSNFFQDGKHFFISIARDITFRQVLNDNMITHKHSLWYALNEASDGLWEWSIEKNTLYVSPKLKQMLGYGLEEDVASVDFWVERIHSEDKNSVLAVMQEHLTGRTDKFEVKYRLKNRAGHFIWVHDKGKVSERNATGDPTVVAGMPQNITDQVALQERLEGQASRDELTGAFNRKVCREKIEKQISISCNTGEPFSIVFMDIDFFKSINDEHGHPVGDMVLKAFVDMLDKQQREGDTLFRWSGEEFILLLPKLGKTGRYQFVDKIRKNIKTNLIRLNHKTEITLTVSMGISTYPYNGLTIEKLIEKADIAMYRAKANGRNRVELFSE
jgi:diguanylate cyclase (GGDEF)-like protein/PAS domain S-box-containing protein